MNINPPKDQLNKIINLYRSGQMLQVMGSCRKLLKTYKKSSILLNMLGAALCATGKFEKALKVYKNAVRLDSKNSELHYNLGFVFQNTNQIKMAIDSYKKAILLNPNHVNAHHNLGALLYKISSLDKAINSYNKAIQLKPDYAEAYSNRGNVFQKLSQLDEAIQDHNKAIQLKPDYAEAYHNRGGTLKDLRQLDKAIQDYNKAIQLKPDYMNAYNSLLMSLNYSSELTQHKIFQKHIEFDKQFGLKTLKNTQSVIFNKTNNIKLRVGYISGDFRNHSVAYFFEPLLKSHDRNFVEVYCYYNDVKKDEKTESLIDASRHWRSIASMNDEDLVSLIKKDNIDILVDLSGHTPKNRLAIFPHRPAPIQVTWLGYPNTTGLSSIDYRLTDNIADPIGEADQLHSEELIRLPKGFLCYQGNKSISTNKELPCLKRGHITFGCFNNLNKITDQVIKVWINILQAIPSSHLLLKSKQFSNSQTKSRYLEIFKNGGISGDRIELYSFMLEEDEHLKLYNHIDIGLDPFPYNGTTTTCEALWMGVPVITMLGNRHASRVGASILTHAGLKEFIATDINGYINMAIEYANNIDSIKSIRTELRHNMQNSNLCNSDVFAKNVEQAYQNMHSKLHIDN